MEWPILSLNALNSKKLILIISNMWFLLIIPLQTFSYELSEFEGLWIE